MANDNPVGKYNKVNVHPIQGGNGTLSDGTGTLNDIGTFSCGDFSTNDRPEVGMFYNISGYHNNDRYEFPGVKCVHSGKTSDFKKV